MLWLILFGRAIQSGTSLIARTTSATQTETPEPAQTKRQKPQPTEHDKTHLNHINKSNLTPGEIEAIKALRADPNISEDAKPPLPEVY